MSRTTNRQEPGREEIAFPPSAPRSIGRYEVVDVLGKGGMANVFLARTRGPAGFSKLFAVKCVHEHLATDPQFVAMFLDEARIAAALHHPNVAQVFELGEDRGAYFLAMEYLHGEHLGTIMKRLQSRGQPPPLHVVVKIVALVADGLHHAHEAEDDEGRPLAIVHRDVSPQNVFVTYSGHVKLTDFGIAKATSNEVRTDTGTVKGKFAYMSPEQALGQPIDRRSDVFALGAMLWEAITGARLFRAPTDAETLLRVTRAEVPPPSSVRPDCPPELDRIVLHCLAVTPAQRYPTAGAVARDLDKFLHLSGSESASRLIAALMSELFRDEIAARQSVVRRATRAESGEGSLAPLEGTATAPTDIEATESHSGARPRLELILDSDPERLADRAEPLEPTKPLSPRQPTVASTEAGHDSVPAPEASIPATPATHGGRAVVAIGGGMILLAALSGAWWALSAPSTGPTSHVDTAAREVATRAPPPESETPTPPAVEPPELPAPAPVPAAPPPAVESPAPSPAVTATTDAGLPGAASPTAALALEATTDATRPPASHHRPPRERSPVGSGSLHLRCEEPVEVAIDGAGFGAARPLHMLDLRAGRHVLVVRSTASGRSRRTTVRVDADDDRPLTGACP